jgi:hypothetical protein
MENLLIILNKLRCLSYWIVNMGVHTPKALIVLVKVMMSSQSVVETGAVQCLKKRHISVLVLFTFRPDFFSNLARPFRAFSMYLINVSLYMCILGLKL